MSHGVADLAGIAIDAGSAVSPERPTSALTNHSSSPKPGGASRTASSGTLADFERAWRPGTHPEGMLRAYAYWSADEREIIGVSFWASQELCEAWRSSGLEVRRREAMTAYVLGEQERFYRGRELHIPEH